MPFRLTVPSKTFLLGEYVALTGGPAILLATKPRFELLIDNKPGIHEGINPKSPAAKFIKKNADFYQNYQLKFIDPYNKLGGLGASSAQFAMVFALKQQANKLRDEEIFDLITEYQQVAWNGKGIAPSGADLVAQIKGGICFFHKAQKEIKIFSWPFSETEFCLIHTGNKIATHVHLKKLTKFYSQDLENIVHTGLTSLEKKDSKQFAAAINHYAEILQSKKLVTTNTIKLLKKIYQQPGVLAAKGCGALGADVIFVLLTKKNSDKFIEWANSQALHVVSSGNHVSHGLEGVSCD